MEKIARRLSALADEAERNVNKRGSDEPDPFWNLAYRAEDLSSEENDFRTFQDEHSSEIARLRTRYDGKISSKLIVSAFKSKTRIRDVFGVGHDLDRSGALRTCVLSTDASDDLLSDHERLVFVVIAAPSCGVSNNATTGGVSVGSWRDLLRSQIAHQQLNLSSHFPEAYGMRSRSGVRDHTAFLYEHVRCKRLQDMLPLKEADSRFRFWSGQLLQALCHIHRQCSYDISESLSVDNVAVSTPDQGRLMMTHIKWGRDLRDATAAKRIKIHRKTSPYCPGECPLCRRQSILTHTFAVLVRQMLGIESIPQHPCSPFPFEALHLDETAMRDGLTMYEGEAFGLRPPASVPLSMIPVVACEMSIMSESEESEELPCIEFFGSEHCTQMRWCFPDRSPLLVASRHGRARIRLRLFVKSDFPSIASSATSDPIATYIVKFFVNESNVSDTVRSILSVCIANHAGRRQATLPELRAHPYFLMTKPDALSK